MKDILKQYNFDFPEELIAKAPASPRDSARLLVYARKTKKEEWDTFKNIGKYLPKNCVLVLNQTKVVPARLPVKKDTGGLAKLLYISHSSELIKALADKPLKTGQKVFLADGHYFTVLQKDGSIYSLRPSFATKDIFKILDEFGEVPLPPYIKNTPLQGKKLKSEYQTVFAKKRGSVAAPTASLHFTKSLLKSLEVSGISIEFLTLHVNLGTFATLTETQLQQGRLHIEEYEISKTTAERLNLARSEGRRIIAVGTTVVRTLESAANKKGMLESLGGTTDIFIRPGYRFRFIDGMVTNFHVPQSSLLMLVSAFVGRLNVLKIYKKAISKGFRLFSFGDGMLVS